MLGRRQIGLLDKPLDVVGLLSVRQQGGLRSGKWRPPADVPVPGLRTGGDDAQRDQHALARQSGRALHQHDKGARVLDPVIGGQHRHHRLWVLPPHVDGREPDSRSRILRQWLNEDTGCISAQAREGGELGPDDPLLLFASDDPQPVRGHGLTEPQHGLLQEGMGTQECKKLLGITRPAERPEPRPAPSRQDHCVQHRCSSLLRSPTDLLIPCSWRN